MWRSYWILNNVYIQNSLKSKLKIIGRFGCALGIIGINEEELMKVFWKTLDLMCAKYWIWIVFVIENSIKLQKMVLEGKI
jgi:hypothetical protein